MISTHLTRLLAALASVLVVLFVIGFTVRLNSLSIEVRSLRRAVSNERERGRATESSAKVITPARPSDLITVISSNRSIWEPDEWPLCNGPQSTCVDRVFAPCDEVRLSYHLAHMEDETFYPAFSVHRGGMVDYQGRAITAEEVVRRARSEGATLQGGAERVIAAFRRGDRTKLVGTYTERGEIDVFKPGAFQLDDASCTDRDSRFEVIDGNAGASS